MTKNRDISPTTPLATSNTALPTPNTPLATPNTALPTPNTPLATSNTALPTPNPPLATSDAPAAAPSTPLPTSTTPLATSTTPVATADTPLPTSKTPLATHEAAVAAPATPLAVRDTNWTAPIWILLVVLCGALFLDGLDVSMIGVALPSIGRGLHLSPSSLQWIVSAYVLGYGGLLLLGGRASDLLGRRRVFLAAVTVFGAASVLSAVVDNATALIALRFIKGASAAFTVPAGLSIITTTFAEGPARSRALSIYTVCGASGFSLGLVFGGLLTELGWRVTFLVPGPIALALVGAGVLVIPRAARSRVTLRELDLPGALTSTAGLLAFVYTVVEAPHRGWFSVWTLGGLLVSLVLIGAFVRIEERHPRPLLRLGILRSAALRHANLAAAVMFGGYVSFQFVATLYLQDSLGWAPIGMALGFLPAGLIVVASATKMGTVLERFDTTLLIAGGLTALLAGYLLFLRVSPGMSYADFLLPTMVLLGLGFALVLPVGQRPGDSRGRKPRAGARVRSREHEHPSWRSRRARGDHRDHRLRRHPGAQRTPAAGYDHGDRRGGRHNRLRPRPHSPASGYGPGARRRARGAVARRRLNRRGDTPGGRAPAAPVAAWPVGPSGHRKGHASGLWSRRGR